MSVDSRRRKGWRTAFHKNATHPCDEHACDDKRSQEVVQRKLPAMIGFPLLLIPFAIYNIFVFVMPGVTFTAPIMDLPLMSGATWAPTFSDALLTLGAVLLLFEVIKASRPGARYLTDHLLSLIVFGAATAEFVLLAPFGSSTFFLLTVLMAVEFLAGVSMSVRNRRHRVPAPAVVPADAVPDVAPAPAGRTVSEPSFEPAPQEQPRPIEPVFEHVPEPAPEPRAELQSRPEPQPEAAPKPVPSLAVIRNSETPAPVPTPAPPAAERKIADWSLADLVSDHEPEREAHAPPKP
jgi:hypothetical protein